MKYVLKLIKKYKLLNKYKLTTEKQDNHLYMLKNFCNNDYFREKFINRIYCELRCYNRLKKLK